MQTPFKGKPKQDRFMEPDEFHKLAAAAKDDLDALRMFVVMGLCGLRTVEVTWLQVKSLDRNQQGLWVKTAKRKKLSMDFVAVDEDSFRLLEDGVKGRKEATPLILYKGQPTSRRQIRYLFHKYKANAGIRKELGPHSLRHLQGIVLTEAGAVPQEVANRLRHTNLAQVMIYSNLRVKRNQEMAQDSARALLPKGQKGMRH